METERYDIVVFGASGFTGQFVVEEVAKVAPGQNLTWAVSGRSMEKIQKVLDKASKRTGADLESIPIIIADTSNEESLLQMAKQARLVLNCVGPYRFYGEQVVKACVEGGAHHLDISGEPAYIEKMQLKYNGEAQKSGVFVISACGFDSIPAESGILFAKKKFEGQINAIESYLEIHAGPHGMAVNNGTLESAIYGFLHEGELKSLRKALFPEPLPPAKYKLPKRGMLFKNDINKKWTAPFLGSDKSVVYRSQRFNFTERKEKPIQFQPYVCYNSLLTVFGLIWFGLTFFIMSKFSFTRKLFLRYSSFFTGGLFKPEGPSMKQIETCSFSMTFVSRGWKNKTDEEPQSPPDTVKITKVTGPEVGYVTTPICMVQAAVVVLKETDKLPGNGVMSRRSRIHPLPWPEVQFYRGVHVSAVVYITWLVYRASREYDGALNIYAFEAGWKWIGADKDVSNYEWHYFYNWFWVVLPFYVGHVALSKIIEWNFIEKRRWVDLIYSCGVLLYLMGWRTIVLFTCHCLFMFLISFSRSFVIVWITSLSLLMTLNVDYTYSLMRDWCCQERDGEFYLMVYTLALTHLRYTSFCLEKCLHDYKVQEESSKGQGHLMSDNSETQNEEPNSTVDIGTPPVCGKGFIDMVFYVFYLPLFFTGPLLTFNAFKKQMNNFCKSDSSSLPYLFLNVVRFLLWGAVNEFLLHFLYFNAIQQNNTLMNRLDLWTLAGVGYWNGQFFMNKYTVLYGVPASVAHLEKLDPPPGPRCVAYIYTYSEMWKYFDRGMYSFIKRYIFFPLGGSESGVVRKTLASVACFVFVYVWHGSEYYVFLWTLFNFVGVIVERIAQGILEVPSVINIQRRYLTKEWIRRLYGFLSVPLFLMSAITAFCFFGGSSVGFIFYSRYISSGNFQALATVYAILYCCVQSSMEIKRNSHISKE
ncbi:protein-cysteine N-palmitoyltransferase HHAT-like [Saccostrea echinata]|uniref:protein-cysteine N-palmitoyltransferase HHAT-like n=1 Tax=Saccostrea echinata TaxID=191078 RepID=UPI002A7F4ED5|nr:protein-cysteine N-palmitoyltransferase HHAT-like [Saccostrea echinata]